jgi:V/A-type H+/Na+-transporting ATPase subunit I
VVISRDNENVDIQAEEVTLPTRSLSSLKDAHVKLQKEVESIESRFTHLARTSLPALENYKNNLTGRLDYEKTVYFTTREADDRLMILEGWVPSDSVAGVNEFLDKTGAAYITAQPSAADKVPVLLKNKGFAQKFEKLGELYSLAQLQGNGYNTIFCPFLRPFFGFCLGDAGYGILIVQAAMIARRKGQ